MFEKFQNRSNAIEMMDDLQMEGEVLEEALVNLERINSWLGGNMVLASGFQQVLESSYFAKNDKQLVTLADMGCGGGEGLRAMADLARKKGVKMKMLGLDANAFTIEYACKRTMDYPEISFSKQDILSESCSWEGIDIVCCSLFLHHFSDEEQITLLQKCFQQGVKAVLINDLQRHWLPYYLFQMICSIFRAPIMTRNDGSLSILKGFKKADLIQLMKKAEFSHYDLRWRWAFRYQLIIYNDKLS